MPVKFVPEYTATPIVSAEGLYARRNIIVLYIIVSAGSTHAGIRSVEVLRFVVVEEGGGGPLERCGRAKRRAREPPL